MAACDTAAVPSGSRGVVPEAGVEPAHELLLRQRPLPLGYSGSSGAPGEIRTPTTVGLSDVSLPIGLPERSGAPAGNRNRLCRLQGGCIATMLQGQKIEKPNFKLTNGRRFRCASQKGGGGTSAVQFWTFTMSNSKAVRVVHARAGSRRAHARRSVLFEDAQPRSRTRAFDTVSVR